MNQFFRRLHHLLHRRRFDRELESDMQFHREMVTSTARTNFGNMLQLREDAADAWGWTWIDRLGQDLHYGIRIMARSPGFTLMAALVLAIGIGVNVAAFSLFDMMALRPLPVPDANRLVRLERRSPDSYTSEMAYPSFLFYRDHARTLSAAMAVLGIPPMQIDNDMTGASSSFVTPNYFIQLGTRAACGRLLDPTVDDSIGAPAVMVISYGLWQRRFSGDPSVIGKTIHLSKKPVTIVGVTPRVLATLGGQNPDIWLPMAEQPYFVDGSKVLTDFGDSSVRMWGKLAPGLKQQIAEQELRSLTNQLRQEHPNAVWSKEFIQVSPGGHLQVMQPEMYQVAAMVAVLTPDARVLLFTLAMSFVSAVLFGLTPALQIARQGQHKTTARQILVTAQVAGSCVLLIVAGLLVRAAHYALHTDPGFGYARLISIDPQLSKHGYTASRANAYLNQMQARLRAVPGVRSVSLVMLPPLGHAVSFATSEINGHTVRVYPNWVTPGFFVTMQTPILLGRTFYPDEKKAVIVSESLARAQWPRQSPLGKPVGDGKDRTFVIGVVADAHLNALNDDDAMEEYWPAAQQQMASMVVIARVDGAAESMPGAAKSIGDSLDPNLLPEVRSIKSLYAQSMLQVERIAGTVTLIGLVALVLAGVGVSGLVSFTIWQKTKEIAIRMALGATPCNVLQLILRNSPGP